MIVNTQKQKDDSHFNEVTLEKEKSYNEIVSFLNRLKPYEYNKKSVERMKLLDNALGNISKKLDIILIGGTNGKSLTMHFATKLLQEEQLQIGTTYSSHFLTYNERILSSTEAISNKEFASVVDQIISVAKKNKIDATSFEIVTMASLLHFVNKKIDVVLLEVCYGGKYDATAAFTPKITAVTRIAKDQVNLLNEDLDQAAFEMMEVARPGSHFVSAEQSKIRLQKMKDWTEQKGIHWSMPIRKLAPLPYIYEQLYGRIASLGERIAQIYVEDIKKKFSPFLKGNLLATKKGQRGRPTLEAKKHAELNPIKTLKVFWRESFDLLKGRFEHLYKEKPSVLLDNAGNLDALANVFLGIRLLHYQKPIKGLAFIMQIKKNINAIEALKLIRYLIKKVNGSIFFVTSESQEFHDSKHLISLGEELNIKAIACKSFEDGFNLAKNVVNEQEGLIVITGSHNIVTEYWKMRGTKKF
jgi:folylpolyglutamate synthase/dihydrofolate synthase